MGTVDARKDEKLQLLLDRIVPALEPEAVYLFGSRASMRIATTTCW
nr:hypothetical protein [uncultured Azospirillum sp.]